MFNINLQYLLGKYLASGKPICKTAITLDSLYVRPFLLYNSNCLIYNKIDVFLQERNAYKVLSCMKYR
jgi:hypothetical protein